MRNSKHKQTRTDDAEIVRLKMINDARFFRLYSLNLALWQYEQKKCVCLVT